MPEGDTIAKLASALYPRIVGRRVDELWVRERGDVRALRGAHVRDVGAIGKHLLIELVAAGEGTLRGPWILRVHLGMHGRWRAYASRPSTGAAPSLWLHVEGGAFEVCTRARLATLCRWDDPSLRAALARVGPDLLGPTVEVEALVARARRRDGATPIADILLDQGVAAGLGNVYKSEVLFLEGLDPRAPLATIGDQQLEALYRRGIGLLQSNLLPGLRTTTLGPRAGVRRPAEVSRHWVYRRHGLPCLRCGVTLNRMLLGASARSTYWCPSCQRCAA